MSRWPAPRRRTRLALLGVAGLAVAIAAAIWALIALVEPVQAANRYVEALADEPPLLNPVLAPYTLAGQDVLPLVFAGLVRSDAAGNLMPDLAERWDVEQDGRVYTFHLRAGLTWHDGTPVDAEDVAFTVRMVQQPDHQGSAELADLWRGVDVQVIDRLAVRFTLPEALASFPEHLTLGLLPRHVLEGVAAKDLPLHPFNRQPVGNGPYRVTTMTPERVALSRFEGYHGAPPRFDEIEFRAFRDRPAALDALLRGEVDGMAHLRPDELQELAASPEVAVYSAPERSKVALLALNVLTPLFRERPVRVAMERAIDRSALVERALAGQAEPALGPIPVQSWAYARVAGLGRFDPVEAASILDEAGWRPGPGGVRERDGQALRFTLLTADSPDRFAVAQVLAEQLAAIGIAAEVRALPTDELEEEHLEPRRFEAAVLGQWTMGSDPDVYPLWHSSQAGLSGGNLSGFSEPDVDRWLESGRQQLDREARRNAYLHFQARWAEEQPSILLYHPLYSFALRKDIYGVSADPVPDASWRLRDATRWYRVSRPTPLQRVRAALSLAAGLPQT